MTNIDQILQRRVTIGTSSFQVTITTRNLLDALLESHGTDEGLLEIILWLDDAACKWEFTRVVYNRFRDMLVEGEELSEEES